MRWGANMRRRLIVPCLSLAFCLSAVGPAEPQTVVKSERFEGDPRWESHNNHIVPEHRPTVVQDFGYSDTNFAGQAGGEVGGLVTRASEAAFCGRKTGPLTLDQKL